MLDYEWGNPSTIMLTGGNEEGGATTGSDQTHRLFFDHYGSSHTFLPDHHFLSQPQHGPTLTTTTATNTGGDFSQHHFNPQAFHGASSTSYPSPATPFMLSLDRLPAVNTTTTCGPGHGLLVLPKSEDVVRPIDFVGSQIGLNLGGRTYFSSYKSDFVSRLYRRPRQAGPGSLDSRRCQAEGCNADLSQTKHYHRRHKVCEFHSKAATVIAAGLTQRFCQQCSRFHLLSEFDNGKRSCRKRLADHNRRRRKTQQQQPTPEIQNSQPAALDNAARSPLDSSSGAQSLSSVTVAVSPPDYLGQRPYQQGSSSSSTTSSSLFFSKG